MGQFPTHDAQTAGVTAAKIALAIPQSERKEGQLRCIDSTSSPPFSVQIALVAVRHPSPDSSRRATAMFRSNPTGGRDEAAKTPY